MGLELAQQFVERRRDGVAVSKIRSGEQGVEHRHGHDVLGDHHRQVARRQRPADGRLHLLGELSEPCGQISILPDGRTDVTGDRVGDACHLAAPAVPVLAVAADIDEFRCDGVLERQPALHQRVG